MSRFYHPPSLRHAWAQSIANRPTITKPSIVPIINDEAGYIDRALRVVPSHSELACVVRRAHRLSARTRTPAPIIKIAIHSRTLGRSLRKRTANTATSNTLSLSTGATFDASPIFSARK